MKSKSSTADMPEHVAAIAQCGFAIWADADIQEPLRARFDDKRIPVKGVRHVRVWGLQVDDEKAIPGMERTSIPDEEIWEVNLEAKDGSNFEFDSQLLKPATGD